MSANEVLDLEEKAFVSSSNQRLARKDTRIDEGERRTKGDEGEQTMNTKRGKAVPIEVGKRALELASGGHVEEGPFVHAVFLLERRGTRELQEATRPERKGKERATNIG
jgi:hypothetical protein